MLLNKYRSHHYFTNHFLGIFMKTINTLAVEGIKAVILMSRSGLPAAQLSNNAALFSI